MDSRTTELQVPLRTQSDFVIFAPRTVLKGSMNSPSWRTRETAPAIVEDPGDGFFEITATRGLTALGVCSSLIAATHGKPSATIKTMEYTRSRIHQYCHEPLAKLNELISQYRSQRAARIQIIVWLREIRNATIHDSCR
jgi:hypothetical protein